MPDAARLTLEFGSHGGSWTALLMFSVIFGVAGWAVAREVRRRSPEGTVVARTVGVSLFLGPLALFWTSSLGGFYVAEAGAKVLQLHYLVPGMRTEVPLADVVTVEARPWYRGRWRLHVSTRTGQRFESATWHREAVIDAAARLNGIMNGE